jgi:predicted dehydrogenase
MQAVLDLMAGGRVDLSPLITHRFPIDRAEAAYDLVQGEGEPSLGIVLEYPEAASEDRKRRLELKAPASKGPIGIGCLGAGSFARTVMLPAIRGIDDFHPRILCSPGGLSASESGRKHGFEVVATEEDEVFSDPDVKAIFILTPHDQHARLVAKSIRAGRHAFVEKPLALTEEEVAEIEDALAAAGEEAPIVTVGFNRRFSPAARKVKEFFSEVAGPLTASVRFNAGPLPADHPAQDETRSGGRIIGEACHAIDLATYLVGAPPVRCFAESVGGPDAPEVTDDQCFITLRHANGSASSIAYLAGGDRALPKERVELFGGGRIAIIEDFKDVSTCVGGKIKRQRAARQEKGHRAEIETFAGALRRGGAAPIPWTELRAVTLASILAVRSLREGMPIDIP